MDHWFEGDAANARRRMKQLASIGLIDRVSLRARSLPVFSSPLISWVPGQAEPEFGKVTHSFVPVAGGNVTFNHAPRISPQSVLRNASAGECTVK